METKLDFRGVNSINFHKRFKDDKDCYNYLADIKWPDENFKCKKCGNNKFCSGKKPFSRRCIKCRYDESPTARTMFDKCKFSLLVAFHIAFKISVRKKGMSSLELSKEFGLRQVTCWRFKRKIQKAMKSSGKYPLEGEVHVDECMIGGPEEHKRGRSHGKKKLVVVALEKLEQGVGRGYAQVIDRASSKDFKPFFETYISKESKVITDEWNGYTPLKQLYPNMEQVPSDSGKGLPDLHIHIMNIKGWLRGIHHHCSREHLQGYLDEFHFRFNRRNNMDTIFNLLIKKMVESEPKPTKSIT